MSINSVNARRKRPHYLGRSTNLEYFMDHSAAINVIRSWFSRVHVEKVIVQYDADIGGDVAKVVVRDDQLDDALRNNGWHARQAAIQSGLNVEVVLADC